MPHFRDHLRKNVQVYELFTSINLYPLKTLKTILSWISELLKIAHTTYLFFCSTFHQVIINQKLESKEKWNKFWCKRHTWLKKWLGGAMLQNLPSLKTCTKSTLIKSCSGNSSTKKYKLENKVLTMSVF